jgi:hypothetical protein
MISIVGFGRPKFGGSAASSSKPAVKKTGSAPSASQPSADVKAAIELLTKKGYKVTK